MEFIASLTAEQWFYLTILALGIPSILVAVKFGFFMTLPRFVLKRFLMKDYNTKRKKDQKRKIREEKKRSRQGWR